MSIENNKLMNLADGKVLYDDLRRRVENVLEDIAPDYSELTFPVAKDTPCVHEWVIYRAGQDIQNSETWTAAHWVAVANVMSEVDGIKSAINELEGSLPTEETGQELLENEVYNTGLTDTVLAVIGMIFNNLPQDEPAIDIVNSLSLECERLNAIYENWMSERSE